LLIIDSLSCHDVIQDVHVFLSSVEKKLRFFDENIPGFFSIWTFNGNQTVQGLKDSFIANRYSWG